MDRSIDRSVGQWSVGRSAVRSFGHSFVRTVGCLGSVSRSICRSKDRSVGLSVVISFEINFNTRKIAVSSMTQAGRH